MIKTGEVFERDEEGQLWLWESFENEKTHEVTSKKSKVEENT